tara:strand:+ start:1206 stop:1382 length:177 start_codon:yes stop_codon:yes gene_type:complete
MNSISKIKIGLMMQHQLESTKNDLEKALNEVKKHKETISNLKNDYDKLYSIASKSINK